MAGFSRIGLQRVANERRIELRLAGRRSHGDVAGLARRPGERIADDLGPPRMERRRFGIEDDPLLLRRASPRAASRSPASQSCGSWPSTRARRPWSGCWLTELASGSGCSSSVGHRSCWRDGTRSVPATARSAALELDRAGPRSAARAAESRTRGTDRPRRPALKWPARAARQSTTIGMSVLRRASSRLLQRHLAAVEQVLLPLGPGDFVGVVEHRFQRAVFGRAAPGRSSGRSAARRECCRSDRRRAPENRRPDRAECPTSACSATASNTSFLRML